MSNIVYYFHFDGNLIAGDNFDIHDNSSVVIRHGEQQSDNPAAGTAVVEDLSQVVPVADDLPLFKYIHPSVTSETAKRQVHHEIQNLVRQFPMPDICRYLRQMCKDSRVYLNVKPEAMFAELHRMGMPSDTTPGFSYKNFMNYFNINE